VLAATLDRLRPRYPTLAPKLARRMKAMV